MQASFRRARINVLYGPTEAAIICATYAVPQDQILPKHFIGKPLGNCQLRIYDQQRQLVPIGVPGELFIGGAGVTRGYLHREELTADKYVAIDGQRWYRSGDLARFLPDGTIEYLGRIDQQVKIRGFRIELGEIEAVMREHPAIGDALVVTRDDQGGDKRLVGYLVPDLSADHAVQSVDESLLSEQVADWQHVFDSAYSEEDDPTFNISGWNSSYTGQPIPASEMRIWVEQTVERILELRPQRVLEIGCGTGLLLFPLAPHCEQYVGTDFSATTLQHLERQVRRQGLSQVVLRQQAADDHSGLEAGQFDVVIINSVVQYFPSIDYLLEVLEGAVALVAPGGRIFVGDVRSLPLLESFHASVEIAQAPASLSTAGCGSASAARWHANRSCCSIRRSSRRWRSICRRSRRSRSSPSAAATPTRSASSATM
jgi:2-polyprenyl-3-methyl-5-hydroxy-6-metoxy-1,4-benzoquinol methylase